MITDGTALGDITPSRFSFLFFPSFTFHLQLFNLIITSDFYIRKIDGEQEETDLVEGAERDKR